MAKEKDKNKEAAAQQPAAASSTTAAATDSGEELSQTDQAFEDYRKVLADGPIADAKSEKDIADKDFEAKTELRENRTKYFHRTKEAEQEYGAISNNITSMMNKDAAVLETNITAYITSSEGVGKALETVRQAIKAAKAKLGEIDDMASRLTDMRKDSVHADEERVLNNGLPATPDKPSYDQAIKGEDSGIIVLADKAKDFADDAFETAVKIFGVHEFSNVKSLTKYGTEIKNSVGSMHLDVTDNITYNAARVTEAQKDLTAVLEELIEAQATQHYKNAVMEGLTNTDTYIGDQVEPPRSMDEILETVDQTFQDDESDQDDD